MPIDPDTPGPRARKWGRPKFLSLTRGEILLLLRRPVIAALHACLIVIAWFGSFAVRLDFGVPQPYRTAMLSTLPFVLAIKLAVFYAFKLFQGWWKYVGLSDLIDIAKATAVSTVGVVIVIVNIFGTRGFPRSVFLLDLVFTFLLLGGVRFVVRAYTK